MSKLNKEKDINFILMDPSLYCDEDGLDSKMYKIEETEDKVVYRLVVWERKSKTRKR